MPQLCSCILLSVQSFLHPFTHSLTHPPTCLPSHPSVWLFFWFYTFVFVVVSFRFALNLSTSSVLSPRHCVTWWASAWTRTLKHDHPLLSSSGIGSLSRLACGFCAHALNETGGGGGGGKRRGRRHPTLHHAPAISFVHMLGSCFCKYTPCWHSLCVQFVCRACRLCVLACQWCP